jgi:hypothetical protein
MTGFQSQAEAPKPAKAAASASVVQVLTRENALQLEEVESNMKQLQADLHEARSRNIYLSELLEDQKRFFYNLEYFLNICAQLCL